MLTRRSGDESRAVDAPAPTAVTPLPALVVFADDVSLIWLRPLRRGFRHCFVTVARDDVWIVCNPLSHYTDLDVALGVTTGELAAWYRHQDFSVVETTTCVPPRRCAPIRPYTCVEAAKRVLGLHAPCVLTPWQLYRHLTKASKVGAVIGNNT